MRIGADKIRKILLANDYVGFASITGLGPIIDQYAYSTLLTFCTAYSSLEATTLYSPQSSLLKGLIQCISAA